MRVGFCCKYIGDDECNMRSTTVAWLNRQTMRDAEIRMRELMHHNLAAIEKLIINVGSGQKITRMVRLGSDILPMYTHEIWGKFWQKPDIQTVLQERFSSIGQLARDLDVRLSFHPGQFTVLASDKPDVVERSIAEFEYHCDMIRWMGYGQKFQDFKCNVHISGAQGAQGIINVLPRLSAEARNVISIENDEISWGIDESLKLVDHCALVLDIHHHWVKDAEFIQPDDPRVQMIIDSWRGERPVIHFSSPRENILLGYDQDTLPDHDRLIKDGHNRMAMRHHSQYYINTALVEWAGGFLPQFDIQTESKAKNLSRDAFLRGLGLLDEN